MNETTEQAEADSTPVTGAGGAGVGAAAAIWLMSIRIISDEGEPVTGTSA